MGAIVPAPYRTEMVVKPAWLDANGHMNVAYYMTAFDDGGEVFFADVGIGWDYTKSGSGTLFMTGSNLDFKRELFQGQRIAVETILLDFSPRLVHTYCALYNVDDDYLAAESEVLFIHVDFTTRRSSDLPAAAQQRLDVILARHGALARPEMIGRALGIRR